MSATTEELRTRLIWDTADVDKGSARVEKAFDRLQKAEAKAARPPSGPRPGSATLNAAASHGSNVAQGIRDLVEGRTLNSLQRFGHVITKNAFALSGLFAVARVGQAAFEIFRNELEKTDTAAERLSESSFKNSRAATFASSGEGPDALSAKIAGNLEQSKGENAQQGDIVSAINMRDTNPLSKLFLGGYDKARSYLTGKQTLDEKLQTSQLEARAAGKDTAKLTNLRSQSYADEAQIALARGPGGNPVDAKQKELDLDEKIAVNRAKEANASEQDLQHIRDRFTTLRATVAVMDEIAYARSQSESSKLTLAGGPASAYRRSLGEAEIARATSDSLLNSGKLNYQEQRAERLALQRAENASKSALESRFLNADGSRRRESEIRRDEREDARSTRLRAQFLRRVSAGAFDPVTGHRRATHATFSTDLHSGGLAALGLDKTDFRDAFARTSAKAESAPDPTDLLGQINNTLDDIRRGLPKATAN